MTEQQTQPSIYVKAVARQNAMSLMIGGVVGMSACALAAGFLWQDHRLNIIFLFLASFVTLLMGLFKHFEPINSFELTPECLTYCHRYGELKIPWGNIMIIDQPRVTEGVESKELAYIGLKLKDVETLRETLSRRLANNLLQEQRDLYFLACQLENIGLFERQINDTPFKMSNGDKVIGPIGAWFYRMEMTRRVYGYDLFIPTNACDREPQAFIALLKECKSASNDYRNEQVIQQA